jgi:phosphoglycolate phosphatase
MVILNSKKIRLVIFDLDGTLVNAYPAIIQSFNYTMHKLGYPLQQDLAIRKAVGWGDKNLLQPFVKSKDLAKALRVYRQHHMISLAKESRLLPGAKRVLQYLKTQGYKLAVASNRPARFSRILLRQLKLKQYFNYMLCGDQLKYGKPHPEILHKIMRKFSLMAADTLYVGDMALDAEASRRAGVRSVIVTTGSSSLQEIKKEKPYQIIKKIIDLLKIFNLGS